MATNRDKYSRSTIVSLPSAQEVSIMRNQEAGRDPAVARRTAAGRGNSYGLTAEQAIAAASMMDRSQVVSPIAGLPVAANAADFKFAKQVLGSASGSHGLWDDYWENSQTGYEYANLAGASVTVGGQTYVRPGTAVTSGKSRQPAALSVMPTSTTNPERPRTVAAGFDPKRAVITVVFRDGTYYNYYDCDAPTWDQFKSEHSKGAYIASVLDGHARGTANMGGAPVHAREQAYRIARTGQIISQGHPQLQFDRTLPPRTNPTRQRKKP